MQPPLFHLLFDNPPPPSQSGRQISLAPKKEGGRRGAANVNLMHLISSPFGWRKQIIELADAGTSFPAFILAAQAQPDRVIVGYWESV